MVEPTSIADVGGQTGPNNGFLPLQKQPETTEDEPMLAKRPKVKVEQASTEIPSADRHKPHEALSNYKVIQCLVLLVILGLVGLLCSVFIKPELYFTEYGKNRLNRY